MRVSMCRQVRNPYTGSLYIEAEIFDLNGRLMGAFSRNEDPDGLNYACGKKLRTDPSGTKWGSDCGYFSLRVWSNLDGELRSPGYTLLTSIKLCAFCVAF